MSILLAIAAGVQFFGAALSIRRYLKDRGRVGWGFSALIFLLMLSRSGFLLARTGFRYALLDGPQPQDWGTELFFFSITAAAFAAAVVVQSPRAFPAGIPDSLSQIQSLALETATIPMILADLKGDVFFANQAFLKTWGFSHAGAVLGRPTSDFWQPLSVDAASFETFREKGAWSGEMVARPTRGQAFDILLTASVIPDQGGIPRYIMIVALVQNEHVPMDTRLKKAYIQLERKLEHQEREIAQFNKLLQEEFFEHKRAQELLAENEQRLRSIVENAGDAIIIFDSNENIVQWNQAAEILFGIPAEEACDKIFSTFIKVEALQEYQTERMRLMHGNSGGPGKIINVIGLRSGGGEMPLELTLSPWKTSDGTFFTVILRDITERKQAEARLEYLATHDLLTGLPNRPFFKERLSHAILRATRLERMAAVILLDLDGFKHINDTWGHARGDKVLQVVALRLKDSLRNGDIVARLGGDEFIVIVEAVKNLREIASIAEKLGESLSQPITIHGQHHFISASMGISTFPSDGKDQETLLMKADTAMYYIKEHGKNGYHFFDPHTQNAALH